MTRAQLVFGSSFIALGSLLLLDRAEVLDASEAVGDWWPVVIVLLGLTQFLMRPRNAASGAFVTIVGLALLSWSVWDVDTLSVLWPLVLVGLGVWMLVRRPLPRRDAHVVTDPEILALFDDRTVRAAPGSLGDRSITTIFGDVDMTLQDASIEDQATLAIVTIFGDVRLTVPDTWRVTVSGPQIFGDVEIDPSFGHAPHAATLHLDVVTVFGDVAVRRTAGDRSR